MVVVGAVKAYRSVSLNSCELSKRSENGVYLDSLKAKLTTLTL